MGPKKGKIMAKNHIGITTGNRASALKQMLFVSCIPITFSHTKYNGVHANPNVMNCIHALGKENKNSESNKKLSMDKEITDVLLCNFNDYHFFSMVDSWIFPLFILVNNFFFQLDQMKKEKWQ